MIPMSPVLYACAIAALAQTPVVIDERFDDWSPADRIATDAVGDSTTGEYDLRHLWARNHGSVFYLSFENLGTPANLLAPDDVNTSLQLHIEAEDRSAISILYRPHIVQVHNAATGTTNEVGFDALDMLTLPTVAAPRYELRVNLEPIGVTPGDTVTITFDLRDDLPNGSVTPPDTLDAPATFTLAARTTPPPRIPTAPDPSNNPRTDIRIAAFNTLRNGLDDRARREGRPPSERTLAFDRLLRAAAADVYLFQEQPSSSLDLAARLERAGLHSASTEGPWRVHGWWDDNAIVTRLPLRSIAPLWPDIQAPDIALPDDYADIEPAIALIGADPDNAYLIMSTHPSCCGYIGNDRDQRRINDARLVADFIEAFRNAALARELIPYADIPIILAGDWNLVGSNTPRQILTSAPANLTHLPLINIDGRDAATWQSRSDRDPPRSFPQGLLDLVAYSADSLIPAAGFVLDSERLTPAELTTLKLEQSDSTRASDHLLLIADFARSTPSP